MSFFTEWRSPSENSSNPHVFNGVLLVFTMLALCIAWVAMCMVIYRYLKKLCLLRRERTQQEVVNAALRALSQNRTNAQLHQVVQAHNCHYYSREQFDNLPTYAEAMTLPPSSRSQPPKDEDEGRHTPSTMSASSDRPAAPPAYEMETSRF